MGLAEKRLRPHLPRLPAFALALAAALVTSACQETTGGGLTRPVQAPGVPVALDALEGAPEPLAGKINDSVVNQAAQRRIDLVSASDPARYHLKGYLTAQSTETGETTVTLVWDVFDSSHNRAQRVSTTVKNTGQAADPWSNVGDGSINRLTAQSMNEVAAFLAGTEVPASGQGMAMGYDGTR